MSTRVAAPLRWRSSSEDSSDVDCSASSVKTSYGSAQGNTASSFQRNLNLYGFSKVIRGDDRGCYMNDNFRRGEKDSLAVMRKRKKQTTKPEQTKVRRTAPSGASEPARSKEKRSERSEQARAKRGKAQRASPRRRREAQRAKRASPPVY